MKSNKEYFAFISYKSEDAEWATWLQHELEHYHLPASFNGRTDVRQDLRPVFRDIDELSAGNLPEQIKQALDNSQNLIVICSPLSAKSPWVNQEVETFISLGRIDRIFPFIVEGNFPKEFFPPALLNLPKDEERLGGDVSKNGKDAAFVKVVAGMLGVGFYSLWNRYEKEKAEIERKQREQRDNLLRLQSRYLVKEAKELLNTHQYDIASLIALEALPNDLDNPNRPYVPEAEDMLRMATLDKSPIIRISNEEFGLGASIPYCYDNKIMVIAEKGYYVKIWDIQQKEYIKSICLEQLAPKGLDSYQRRNGHFDYLALIPSNECQIIVCCENSLYLFDYVTEKVTLLYRPSSKEISFSDIVFSPDNRYILCIADSVYTSLGTRHETFLVEFKSSQFIQNLSFASAVSVSFSPDNKYIAYAGGQSVHVFEILKDMQPYKLRLNNVCKCCFFDNNNIILTCSDNSLKIWNFVDQEVQNLFQCNERITDVLCYNQLVALCTVSHTITIIDVKLRFPIATRQWHSKVRLLSFSNDGAALCFSDENTIRTWDYHIRPDGRYLLYYHPEPIRCSTYNIGCTYFVSASDNYIAVWDVRERKIRYSFSIGSYINQIAINSKANQIAFVDNRDAWVINCETEKATKIFSDVIKILISPNDRTILVAGNDTITLFDAVTLKTNQIIAIPESQSLWAVDCVAFNPQGNLVATITTPDDPSLMVATIWDCNTGQSMYSITYEAGFGESIVFSSDGNHVIIDNDKFWNYKEDQMIHFKDSGSDIAMISELFVLDGCFVEEREKMPPLQELIDETRERFKDRQLTPEERRKYYLE